MKSKSLVASWALWLLCMQMALPPGAALAVERLAASDGEKLSILKSVQSMHRGGYSDAGPDIRVFEIGGGDPAMNGAFLYLCIEHNEKSYVWETKLNVRNIYKITYAKGNRIVLAVHEDYFGKNNKIASRSSTYQFQFFIDKDVLQDTLTLEKK